MVPPKTNKTKRSKEQNYETFFKKYVNVGFIKYIIFDPASLSIVSALIILAEFVINVVIIQYVPYTEIDWKAYMQECEGFINGTTNYAKLRGDTGPLVYPAAFVYIYSILYFVTTQGTNVRLAQHIFAALYLLQMYLVLRLYRKSRKVPPYVLVLSVFTSYRIHSIYVLRLFNDPIAVAFLYAALNLFMDRHWTLGSILFSLGVGVKMNILLFSPALLLFYLANLGIIKTFIQLLICAIVQLMIGAPFLLTYPLEYLKGSFDLGRIFEHRWTVNYRFMPQSMFEHKYFHLTLIAIHLMLLILFARPTWTFFKSYVRLRELQKQFAPQLERKNRELKTTKTNNKKQAIRTVFESEHKEFTDDQKSFEKNPQKAAAFDNPKPAISQFSTMQTKENIEKYSIHFDQSTQLALLPFFIANFIGVACSRSLHYQFYIWYFHSLPYLVFTTPYTLCVRFLILGLIEYCWNAYPSTNFSSYTLHICHIILLIGVVRQINQITQLNATMRNVQQNHKAKVN